MSTGSPSDSPLLSASATVAMLWLATFFAAAWSVSLCLRKALLATGGGMSRMALVLHRASRDLPIRRMASTLFLLTSQNFLPTGVSAIWEVVSAPQSSQHKVKVVDLPASLPARSACLHELKSPTLHTEHTQLSATRRLAMMANELFNFFVSHDHQAAPHHLHPHQTRLQHS
eukprot:scpid49227/ scgid23620/ 